MPGFFSRRRKPNPAPVRNWAVLPHFTDNKSFVEQKIHPDINSLAEELASTQGLDMTVDKGNPEIYVEVESTGFVGLEPSKRRDRKQNGAHTRAQVPERVVIESKYQQTSIPHLDPANVTSHTESLPGGGKENICLSGTTSSPSGSPTSLSAPSPKKRWSIFGRSSARVPHRNSDASNATSSVSRPRSQSSRTTSQGRITLAEASQPRTPKSQSSMYNSTHHTESTPYNLADDLLPSPHTFGIPTPPQEPTTGSAHDNSYFGFRETPPPLPPLNHPAFRQASKGHISQTTNIFPIQTIHGDVQEKFPRHCHSLPSLAHSVSSETQCDTTKGSRKRHRRASSRSNKFEISSLRRAPIDRTLNKKEHNRNGSVASSIGTRRSSAEYSAKNASSVGHGGKKDECWEVQVSKEMVRLAFGEVLQRVRVDDTKTISPLGQACGENLALGEVVGLGSPFLLQDTLTRNLRDTNSSNEYTAISSPKLIYKSSNISTKPLRADTMSYGDASIVSGNAGRKGKERESAVTPNSSHSRRGGRTSSTPSRTKTLSLPPNLDTTPFFGSIRGSSSLLVPPALSVISPTPDVSPVSPSPLPSHNSQPTVPTTSVSKRPNTPPQIEQSQSTSGKRKAEDAGDKTPPKDPKEQRATFAPDPRTHRTSTTSGLSSHAPSSFNRSKRVRLTESFDARSSSRSNSRTGSLPTPEDSPPNAKNTGSWSSRGSRDPKSATSHTHAPSTSHHSHSHGSQTHRPSSRRSLSQASIPISALVSPHAPSVGLSGAYHMRDPRKPPPVQSTTWALAFPSKVREGEPRWAWKGWVERGGSPLHAWIFFIGFILFPLWWAGVFMPVRRTRRLGSTDAEKGVVLDDPQLEHDAKSWRTRCRIMAAVSLITYIPFIALVAVFV
ncbi:hypothetical protein BYT27DRAFT_7247616 [Phlegmacium glaucopus]|nr:hypothetical protein BYT27DRAFT_7247616 [Phlegmacium glaucopus]